jgi:hypothetical protein
MRPHQQTKLDLILGVLFASQGILMLLLLAVIRSDGYDSHLELRGKIFFFQSLLIGVNGALLFSRSTKALVAGSCLVLIADTILYFCTYDLLALLGIPLIIYTICRSAGLLQDSR